MQSQCSNGDVSIWGQYSRARRQTISKQTNKQTNKQTDNSPHKGVNAVIFAYHILCVWNILTCLQSFKF